MYFSLDFFLVSKNNAFQCKTVWIDPRQKSPFFTEKYFQTD